MEAPEISPAAISARLEVALTFASLGDFEDGDGSLGDVIARAKRDLGALATTTAPEMPRANSP